MCRDSQAKIEEEAGEGEEADEGGGAFRSRLSAGTFELPTLSRLVHYLRVRP